MTFIATRHEPLHGTEGTGMGAFHLDFQSGFNASEVEVFVDDVMVLRKAGIKTRYQIGLADSCKLDLSPGVHIIRVRHLGESVEEDIHIDPEDTPHLGVNFLEGQLEFTPSAEPFRYL